MLNIEYKIFIGASQEVKKRLEILGAKYVGAFNQKDTYFNYGGGRLKLREVKNKKAELILYHRPNNNGSRLSDYKIIVLDKKNQFSVFKMLSNLFGKKVEVRKTRNLWIFNNTRVHLDNVRGLGKFLELETVISKIDCKTAQKEQSNIKKILKLNDFKPIRGSYCELMLSNKAI